MFNPSLSDYAPTSTTSVALKSQETHFFSFKIATAEKQGMGYQARSHQQYLCHFTDQRFIFESVNNQTSFEVKHDAIERLKLIRTISLSSYAKIIFHSPISELSTSEWMVSVSSVKDVSDRSRAKDFVQFGNELLGVAPGGFQVVADDPKAIEQFKQEIAASDVPVLVDFWAPRCEPCEAMRSIVNELAAQFDGQIKLIKVDIEKNPAVPMHYKVNCFPTLMLFKSGAVAGQIVGAVPKPVIAKVLTNHLATL